MARILKHLLLLTLVVELILPVGWCCRPTKGSARTVSVNAGTHKSCCHAPQAPVDQPPRRHCPATPSSKCCCSVDSVAPEKVVIAVDIDSMPTLSLAARVVDVPRYELHLVERGAFQTGPPRNVLLCVWTC